MRYDFFRYKENFCSYVFSFHSLDFSSLPPIKTQKSVIIKSSLTRKRKSPEISL
nr:MAG TPA: hypothetical protein [Caudoviricetes sp.]